MCTAGTQLGVVIHTAGGGRQMNRETHTEMSEILTTGECRSRGRHSGASTGENTKQPQADRTQNGRSRSCVFWDLVGKAESTTQNQTGTKIPIWLFQVIGARGLCICDFSQNKIGQDYTIA